LPKLRKSSTDMYPTLTPATSSGRTLQESLLADLGSRISPTASKEPLSRAWQWKSDLETGRKTKFDLYAELAKAPPEIAYYIWPTQAAAHASTVLTKQFAGGWRVGKSMWLAAEALPYMFKDNAEIWIVANDYVLGRYEWKYIHQWLKWLGVPLLRVNDPGAGSWRIETAWHATLRTQTADDVTKIEGGNLDAAVIAEAGLMDPEIIRRIGGRVMTKGGPVLMSGSLDASEPWYMEAFEKYLNGPVDNVDWQSWGMPSWENTLSFPGGREDPKIKERESILSEDEFKLKIACQRAKPQELVFSEFDVRTHVVDFEFSDLDSHGARLEYPEAISTDWGMTINKFKLPRRDHVHLAIDPGSRGAYAVLAIRKYDDQIYVIDEVYLRLTMVDDVIAECKMREWWDDVDFAVMDIAGKQQPAMASQADIWAKDENLHFYPAMSFIHIEDGVEHLKTWLKNPLNKQPRLWVSPKCKGLIKEFGLYRYRTEKENRPISEAPVDANNHSIKALIYYLVNRFKIGGRGNRTSSAKYVGNNAGQVLSDGRNITDPNAKRYLSISHWAMDDSV
jgi:hypothetical protein